MHKGGTQSFHQHVVDGAEIRGEFLRDVAGQEPQVFIGLKNGARHDNLLDVLVDERLRGFRRADPGLAAARFAGGEDQLFTLDSIQVVGLSVIAGRNRRVVTGIPRHAYRFHTTHLHKRGDRFFFTLFMTA